mmetsp:Transcript_47973/g.120033  ORF Transcript_47973/g.120033 Transcript_47973/m.120033 type:complete len:329 (-) Transcript_47973:2248-3234(-)
MGRGDLPTTPWRFYLSRRSVRRGSTLIAIGCADSAQQATSSRKQVRRSAFRVCWGRTMVTRASRLARRAPGECMPTRMAPCHALPAHPATPRISWGAKSATPVPRGIMLRTTARNCVSIAPREPIRMIPAKHNASSVPPLNRPPMSVLAPLRTALVSRALFSTLNTICAKVVTATSTPVCVVWVCYTMRRQIVCTTCPYWRRTTGPPSSRIKLALRTSMYSDASNHTHVLVAALTLLYRRNCPSATKAGKAEHAPYASEVTTSVRAAATSAALARRVWGRSSSLSFCSTFWPSCSTYSSTLRRAERSPSLSTSHSHSACSSTSCRTFP